jgi:hypothetical protein
MTCECSPFGHEPNCPISGLTITVHESAISSDTLDYLGQRLLRDVKEYLLGQWLKERLSNHYLDALSVVMARITKD